MTVPSLVSNHLSIIVNSYFSSIKSPGKTFWGKRKMRGRGKGKKEEDTQSAHCPDSSPSSSSSSPATITVRDKVDYATVSIPPDKAVDKTPCSLCYEPWDKSLRVGSIRQTPCAHTFHRVCLMVWLKRKIKEENPSAECEKKELGEKELGQEQEENDFTCPECNAVCS